MEKKERTGDLLQKERGDRDCRRKVSGQFVSLAPERRHRLELRRKGETRRSVTGETSPQALPQPSFKISPGILTPQLVIELPPDSSLGFSICYAPSFAHLSSSSPGEAAPLRAGHRRRPRRRVSPPSSFDATSAGLMPARPSR